MATSSDHITLTQTISAFLHFVEQKVDDYLRSSCQLIDVVYAYISTTQADILGYSRPFSKNIISTTRAQNQYCEIDTNFRN